jgi:hypothetical protein
LRTAKNTKLLVLQNEKLQELMRSHADLKKAVNAYFNRVYKSGSGNLLRAMSSSRIGGGSSPSPSMSPMIQPQDE